MEGGTTQWGGYKTPKVKLKISFIYFLLPSKLLANVLRYRIFLCWHHTAWGLMFSKILYQGAEESRTRNQKDSGQGSAERVKGRTWGLTVRWVGLGSHSHSVSTEIFLDYLKIDTNCFTDCASILEEGFCDYCPSCHHEDTFILNWSVLSAILGTLKKQVNRNDLYFF